MGITRIRAEMAVAFQTSINVTGTISAGLSWSLNVQL